ncbi:MAG: alpha/beta hydrolase-fold protein, partial [Myxococcota bacterium]
TTTTTTTTTTSADLALVTDLVDGRASVDDVVPAIGWSGGWPVHEVDPVEGEAAWFVVPGDDGPWSVATSVDGWIEQPMVHADGFWWLRVSLGQPSTGATYKLVSDGVWIADPLARSYTYDAFGEMSYVAAPTDLPRLDRWPGLDGEGLAPRDLRVYVPAGAGPWPVLYANDGQNLFDPGAIWGGWHLQDALADRAPILVVGIDNTIDRFDEYTHVPDDIGYGRMGGEGDAYAALIEDHVRPHIEATYGSTGVDGLLGSSLGGLIALHVADRYPGRYDFVASLSGTLGWGRFGADNETIEERWLASLPLGTAVYVDSGGGPGEDGCQDLDGDGFPEDDPDSADNYCETRQFADALAAAGFTWDVDLWHWWEPDAPHAEIAWAARVGMPLDEFLTLAP